MNVCNATLDSENKKERYREFGLVFSSLLIDYEDIDFSEFGINKEIAEKALDELGDLIMRFEIKRGT